MKLYKNPDNSWTLGTLLSVPSGTCFIEEISADVYAIRFINAPSNIFIGAITDLERSDESPYEDIATFLLECGDFFVNPLNPLKEDVEGLQEDVNQLQEETANKQNSLAIDGTGAKYPTVDAVNAGLALKGDATQQWVTDNFVEKETGKSLIADTEITKLATIDFTQEKIIPIDADSVGLWDSVTSIFKRTTWANVKATLKTYNDTLYENKANKKTTLTDSDTDYPTTKAVNAGLAGKQNTIGYTPENTVNKQNSLAVDGTGSKYPTVDAVNEGLSDKITEDAIYKVLQIGGSGLVTLKPTTSHFTYRLNVTANMTLNIDLSRMIQQVGSARCRLIIDMPIVRTITITKPLLWGGTAPTFAAAGQYIFEIIDVDGSGTPLIWQVASTTKVEPTGVILYVDSTGADYTVGQINGETATRTTSSWATPFKYLQNAINAASSGDIIFVKQGVHKPTHLRATPTSYTDGDHLNRNATFTPKNGVDIYGGFVGTESKTWQRVVDDNGHMVNQTILCGDVLNEAVIDEAITVGDRRTTISKANAAYHVLYSSGITSLTYINGVTLRYGNANGAGVDADGGGMRSATNYVAINCIANNNTGASGGGWREGTNTNCIANNNTGANGGGWRFGTNTNCIANNNTATYGGGWREGTNTNCIANNNTANTGGGWFEGTNTNCIANNNTATAGTGGGWRGGTNTNCIAYSNTAVTDGGGWRDGINTNCTAYSNTASGGGGWYYGTNTNCIATNNTTTNTGGGGWNFGTNTNCIANNNTAPAGGGWREGININCTGINNRAPQAVYSSTSEDTNINCLLFNNKNASGTAVGFDNKTASGVKKFLNNAYDVAHPTITGGAGSEIDTATCIQNLTAEQAKIEVPSFVGNATTPEQLAELEQYVKDIPKKLKPKLGSILKGAGVRRAEVSANDFNGDERLDPCTIGAIEGE